jgi:hypothetical protein
MSPSNRSKSPPKRSMTNDTINTERLKIARDEAERAMKVIDRSKKNNNLVYVLFRNIKYLQLLDHIQHFENLYDGYLNFFFYLLNL